MIPKTPQRKTRFDEKTESEYIRSTWAFQRGFVRACLVPFPFALLVVLHWFLTSPLSPPPLMAIAIALGSLGAHLGLAFFYWRCPQCSQILYRTSGAGASYTFWLSDPDDCPYCGARLVAGRKPKPTPGPTRPKGEKY